MRVRVLLLVAVAFIVGLTVALVHQYRSRLAEISAQESASPSFVTPIYKTNTVVRRESFTWDEIESSDFKAYIANLRRISCPEPTIRDIIVAEVNALYEKRRAMEIITPEQQWWRADPDPAVSRAATDQLIALERERRALLVELLGQNWENPRTSQLADFNFYLDGPVLGRLPPQTKEAIRQVEAEGLRRYQVYLANVQAAGRTPDEGELVRLRQRTRAELTTILDPIQLEEYLLRYSRTAQRLREETRGLGINADEFRKVFRVRDEIDQQIHTYFAASDAASVKAREDLERRRDEAMKQALGPDRYQLYRFSQDPLFRQAQAVAEQAGANAEVVLPVYQINQAAEEEGRRLQSDQNLTTEERTAALQRLVMEREESLRKILGRESYELFRASTVPSEFAR